MKTELWFTIGLHHWLHAHYREMSWVQTLFGNEPIIGNRKNHALLIHRNIRLQHENAFNLLSDHMFDITAANMEYHVPTQAQERSTIVLRFGRLRSCVPLRSRGLGFLGTIKPFRDACVI